MSDPVCCILAVCCPGGSERQRETLAEGLIAAGDYIEPKAARACADWILDHFDLAPKDSLAAFKGEIVRLAKGNSQRG